MRTLIIAALAALTFAVSSQSTLAQPQCNKRDTIVAQLSKKHKEQQAAMGVTADGRLLEVWGRYETGSFTVLMTWPDMRSCVIASGQQLEVQPLREYIARFEF